MAGKSTATRRRTRTTRTAWRSGWTCRTRTTRRARHAATPRPDRPDPPPLRRRRRSANTSSRPSGYGTARDLTAGPVPRQGRTPALTADASAITTTTTVTRQVLGPADFAAIKRLREQAELANAGLSKGEKRRQQSTAADEYVHPPALQSRAAMGTPAEPCGRAACCNTGRGDQRCWTTRSTQRRSCAMPSAASRPRRSVWPTCARAARAATSTAPTRATSSAAPPAIAYVALHELCTTTTTADWWLTYVCGALLDVGSATGKPQEQAVHHGPLQARRAPKAVPLHAREAGTGSASLSQSPASKAPKPHTSLTSRCPSLLRAQIAERKAIVKRKKQY